jgi:hypothetical protein
MSDLVARLRSGEDGLEYAAADELDALHAENARLREALIDLLDDAWVQDFGEWFEDRLKQASAALAGEVKS